MPRKRKNKPNTRRSFRAASTFQQRAHSTPEDTAEPTAGTSQGQVVGVEGTAATSGNEPTASKHRKKSVANGKTSDATSGNQKPSREPQFNFGSSQFSDLKTTDHFVDKTRIIEVLFNDSPMVLITRPRRFGKSTIMNMVKEFVTKKVYTRGEKVGQEIERTAENERAFPEMNLLLFHDENLKISKWDKFSLHHGKYPTIYVDFQTVSGDDYLEILLAFRESTTGAFKEHTYLLDCEDLWVTENQPRGNRFDKKTFENYLNPKQSNEEILAMLESSTDEVLGRKMKALEDVLSSHIKVALYFLAQVLHQHFGHKIYLLIDEYDAPINNTIFKNKEHCKKVNELLNNLFKNLLKKGASMVERALLTGISYLGSVGLSGVNNVQKHMFLKGAMGDDDRYEEFYGVTEEELQQLTTKFTEEFWQSINKLPPEQVSSYYNGYKSIGKRGVKIYPIWSIVHALETGKLDNYWESSGIMVGAREGFNIPIVLLAIEKMLRGTAIKCEIPYRLELTHLLELSDVISNCEASRTLVKPDVYLSFLMQQGYLMCVEKLEEEDTFKVKIPNTLIENEFKDLMEQHFGDNYDDLITKVTAVFDNFPEKPDQVKDDIVKKLIRSLQNVFIYVSRKWNKPNEDAYRCVIFHCLCKSRYMSWTETQGTSGRLDIAFNSEKKAVIIEIKYCKNALEAISQILEKNYVKSVRKKLSQPELKCVIMGLNVDKNNIVSIAYKNADKHGPPREVMLQNED